MFLNDVYTLTHEKSLRQRATLFLELVPKDDRREAAETAKRILDVVAAAFGLLLLAPLFLVVGVAIKLTSPGPTFLCRSGTAIGGADSTCVSFVAWCKMLPP